MEIWINRFYEDVQPIVSGIIEYRDLLNSEDISNKIKFIRRRISLSLWGINESKNNLMINRINSVRKPQEMKKEKLKKMSKDIWQKMSESLENWDYWYLNNKVEILIKNRIIKNLQNWDFTAIDFIVESMKNPIQYIIPEKESSNPYWNN